jgi:hypothetical protein
MAGYNHYSWCTCPWCYQWRYRHYKIQQIVRSYDYSYEKRQLKEYGVTRSWAACFVEPNARCPVCGATVFYYENQFGSRVYFDELGAPWPKHPCTDNRGRRITKEEPCEVRPTGIRPRGEILEIFELVNITAFDPAKEFAPRFGSGPWSLFVILHVVKNGFQIAVNIKQVSCLDDDDIYMQFTSAKMIPVIGDYISFNGNEVSMIDRNTLEPRRFKAGFISREQFSQSKS